VPYRSPEEVAEKVRGTKKLSEKQRRQFQHVFNSCFEKHGDDALCHKMAWGAVKGGKKSGCDGEVCDALQEYFDAAIEGRIDWGEMNRRRQERQDREGVMDNEMIAREVLLACRDIEAADRIALGLLDEVKVKKLKRKVVSFLHRLGDFRKEMANLIGDLTGAVEDQSSLREFPELKDILALGRAMRQVRLSPRDVESRIVKVVTVDATT